MSQVRRRRLLIAAGALLGAPILAFAQPKPVRIGFLNAGSRQSPVETGRLEAFVKGMRALGYMEGTHFVLDARYVEGKAEQSRIMAAELARGGVRVIVTFGGIASRAAQLATSSIPIVVISSSDPVREGYAMTMARPGGNLTGLATGAGVYIQKHYELLVAVAPKIARIGIILNPENAGHGALLLTIQSIALSAGKQVFAVAAGSKESLESGFPAIVRERADALIVFPDNAILPYWKDIATFAISHRLPTVHQSDAFAEAGGLFAYGPDLEDMCRRAALFVVKLIKGASPSEMPFELPMTYQLVINGRTAKALGIKIPQSVMIRAERVIQ
jgi:putative tryptophan/tyrosine transport system substrate-binding protein